MVLGPESNDDSVRFVSDCRRGCGRGCSLVLSVINSSLNQALKDQEGEVLYGESKESGFRGIAQQSGPVVVVDLESEGDLCFVRHNLGFGIIDLMPHAA